MVPYLDTFDIYEKITFTCLQFYDKIQSGVVMVEIKCSTKDTIKLTDCVAFQGNLKKRTQQNIDELKQSLSTEGLLMPFAVWVHDNTSYLLDGHGRK
jgi:hypothetical protein